MLSSGRPDSGYVYIIGGDGGPLKIGHSTNIRLRLKTLRWELGRDVFVMSYIEAPAGDLLGIERLAHFLLRDRALGRELFDVGLQKAIDAVCDAQESYALGLRAPRAADDPERAVLSVAPVLPSMLLARIADWRVLRRKIPSRSAAIRELLEIGLRKALPGE